MRVSQLTILVLLSIQNCIHSQDTIKSLNFSSQLKLEKYFTIHHPNSLVMSTMKMKSRDGKIYLLNDNFISGKGLVLFEMDLQNNSTDTNFIQIDDYAVNLSDFDVCEGNLFLLISGSFIVYNLKDKTMKNIDIKVPLQSIYRHFYATGSNTLILYEWQIGNNKREEKSIYKYQIDTKEWAIMDPYQLDGLAFLGVNSHDKHIDVNSNLTVKFNPDRYNISVFNHETSARHTIIGNIDSSMFISGDLIRKINVQYNKKAKMNLFDSLDKHCNEHTRLYSIRASGDSIIYVSYSHLYENCNKSYKSMRNTEYLDVWKYNKTLKKWELFLGFLRLDNRAGCNKKYQSNLKDIYFHLLSTEAWWCVYGDYLIIPKKMPENVDLEGDITPYYNRDNFNGGLNLQIMVFKLPVAVD